MAEQEFTKTAGYPVRKRMSARYEGCVSSILFSGREGFLRSYFSDAYTHIIYQLPITSWKVRVLANTCSNTPKNHGAVYLDQVCNNFHQGMVMMSSCKLYQPDPR